MLVESLILDSNEGLIDISILQFAVGSIDPAHILTACELGDGVAFDIVNK